MSGDIFDIERIRRLVQLMEEHDLAEVDLRQEDQQIKLSRGAGQIVAPVAQNIPVAAPSPAQPAAAPAEAEDSNLVTITAPMVGTFYTKPKPESPAFVSVGQSITADTTVCIVEAMKVFNEIPAEVSGKIVAVLATDGEAVDFGKPLFKVDPAG